MTDNKPTALAMCHEVGGLGRMLDGSKSGYSKRHPEHLVFFNANVYDQQGDKVWFGDVDLTADREALLRVVRHAGPIYVARESPWRWTSTTPVELDEAALAEYPSVYKITVWSQTPCGRSIV